MRQGVKLVRVCINMKKSIPVRHMEVVRLKKLSVLLMASVTCLSTIFIPITGLLPPTETV